MKTFLVILTVALVSVFAADIASAQQVRASDGTTSKPGHGFVDAPAAVLGTDGGYSGGWGLKRVPATAGASDSMCVVGDNLTVGCFTKPNGYSGRVDAGIRTVTCAAVVWGATDAGTRDTISCDAGIGALASYSGASCSVGLPAGVALPAAEFFWCTQGDANTAVLTRTCIKRAGDATNCAVIASGTYKATFFLP